MTYSATIGFFDGVHLGHRFILQQLVADALRHGLQPLVITFRNHPRQVLSKDYCPQLLTTPDEKTRLIRQSGVENIVHLDFTPEMAAVTAREFMVKMKEEMKVSRLLMGYDNRFGKYDPAESFASYQQYGREIGIEVVALEAYEPSGLHISSSEVRRLLGGGLVREAARCLGYDYGFAGTVVHGFGEGRKLGFPTANMQLAKYQLVPKRGVYLVSVNIEGHRETFRGMMNIGVRPTYGGEFRQTNEVHILDFDEDIYGMSVTVRFIDRIRDEKKFNSLEELKLQLRHDEEICHSSL